MALLEEVAVIKAKKAAIFAAGKRKIEITGTGKIRTIRA